MELSSRRPVALAAPSLHTLYGADVDCSGYLAVAVSQSGRTPEIVTTLERMQAAGAAGLAVTNDAESPLAGAAAAALAPGAREEHAGPPRGAPPGAGGRGCSPPRGPRAPPCRCPPPCPRRSCRSPPWCAPSSSRS